MRCKAGTERWNKPGNRIMRCAVAAGTLLVFLTGLLLGMPQELRADSAGTHIRLWYVDSEGKYQESDKLELEQGTSIRLVAETARDLVSMYAIRGVLTYERKGVSPSQRFENVFRDMELSVSTGGNEEIVPVTLIQQRGDGQGYNFSIHFSNQSQTNVARTILKGEQLAVIDLTVNADAAEGFRFSLTDLKMIVSVDGSQTQDLVSEGCSLQNTATRREVALSVEQGMTAGRDSDLVVPVRIEGNTGFDDLVLQIQYDSNDLRYRKAMLAPGFRSAAEIQMLGQEELPEGYSPYTEAANFEIYNRYRDITLTEQEMVYLYFEVKENAKGSSTPIQVYVKALSNSEGTYMRGASLTDAYLYETDITLTEVIEPGDVNMDGEVTLTDAAYLLQYYNGLRILSDLQIRKGDVNCSGGQEPSGTDITLLDVLMIMQRFNGVISDSRWYSITSSR